MNILLINDNPMVSGLLKLCTRESSIFLYEIRDSETLQERDYDAVFIDEGVYHDQMWQNPAYLNITTKVFFSHSAVAHHYFDITIKKPFSPLQIIRTLQELGDKKKNSSLGLEPETSLEKKNLKQDVGLSGAMEKRESQVLDMDELRKIQELLEMTEEMEVEEEPLSEEEIQQCKLEAITEQLIADGVEIVSEETIVEELETMNHNKKSKSTYTQSQRERMEHAMYIAVAALNPKKLKKLLKGKKVKLKMKLEER